MPRVLRVALLIGASLIVGCGPNPVHHVQSELLLDGSVDRAILQPLGKVFDEQQWDESRSPDAGKKYDNYDGDLTLPSIPGEPQQRRSDGHQNPVMILARKRVKPGDVIPLHVEFRREGIDESSTLKLQRVVNDYGLVTECLWDETLTEVLDITDSARARRELVTLFADQCARTFKRGFEPEYDATELISWIRTNGGDAFEEFFQSALQCAAHEDADARINRFDRIAARLLKEQAKKFDVALDEPQTDPSAPPSPKLFSSVSEAAVQNLWFRIAARNLKRRDGQSVNDEAVRRLMLDAQGHLFSEQWNEHWRAAMADYPGGEAAFQQIAAKLMGRICGIHGGLFGVLGSREPFRCSIKMPGVIIETNGTQLSEREVQWRFTALQAFPRGYAMKARSIVVCTDRFPGMRADWAKDRRNWLTLVTLAAKEPRIAKALRECRERRSLHPLEVLRTQQKDSDLTDDVHRALKILSAASAS